MRTYMWKQKVESGVMTVEASVIIPTIMLITAALIILTFFVHNRNYYIAAGYEAALTGNAWYKPQDDPDRTTSEAAARNSMEERIQAQPLPGSEPQPEFSFSKSETSVSLSGQKFPAFSEDLFSWTVEVKADRVRPVTVIRMARVARKAAEKIRENGSGSGDGSGGGENE